MELLNPGATQWQFGANAYFSVLIAKYPSPWGRVSVLCTYIFYKVVYWAVR